MEFSLYYIAKVIIKNDKFISFNSIFYQSRTLFRLCVVKTIALASIDAFGMGDRKTIATIPLNRYKPVQGDDYTVFEPQNGDLAT